jgi:hypothetical protein
VASEWGLHGEHSTVKAGSNGHVVVDQRGAPPHTPRAISLYVSQDIFTLELAP